MNLNLANQNALNGLFTPSQRKGSAKHIFTATNLILEAFVVFFVVLVAGRFAQVSGQSPLPVVVSCFSLIVLLLLATKTLQRRYGYVFAGALQLPLLLLGFFLPMMWAVGFIFNALFWFALYKGHQADIEKDQVDAAVLAERTQHSNPK